MNLWVNTTRNPVKLMKDEARRRAEARRNVKMFLIPRDAAGSDSMVPDYLVSESMINRYLAIEPPQFRGTTKFDAIIEEIERTFVLGMFFSALSAPVVVIERMLNTARIELHKRVSPKIKELWDKGPTNEWQPNIEALVQWKYLGDELAQDLSALYPDVRCKYLHSGSTETVEEDSLRATKAAYQLLKEIIGFPERLFKLGSFGVECLDPSDPLVQVFYTPKVRLATAPYKLKEV